MSILKLGEIIRRRREELGVSQEDLAYGICSVPTLSRVENGERMPTQSHLEAILQRRGDFALLLHRLSGCPAPGALKDTVLKDVPSSSYYHDAVVWAVNKGIINGTEISTVGSTKYITFSPKIASGTATLLLCCIAMRICGILIWIPYPAASNSQIRQKSPLMLRPL